MRTIQHWIAGTETTGTQARFGPVHNPATGEQQAQVALAGVADVDAAVAAAKKAFEEWRDVSLIRRARVMFALRDLVERHLDDFAGIIADEHGKVFSDAKGEVIRGLEVIEYACGIPTLLKGEYSEQVSTDIDAYSFRQPLGVVAGITPFNFPAMVPMWMHPIAIAAGNAFILKPSERDPSASNLMARLYAEAGLPDGVFNVVHGDKIAVNAILQHRDIEAVSFVGSTPIARYVYETATKTGKRVQALGGAKNHAVVLQDADLEFAANHITAAGYGSAGQRCMAISAVVAVGEAGDALIRKLAEKATQIRTGPGRDPQSEMGPVVTLQAKKRIENAIEGGVQHGATLVVDGRNLAVKDHENGFFIGPSLFDHVTTDMDIYRDEIFGPVLVVLRADTLTQAIDIINSNPYGNGTAIFTSSGQAAKNFQRNVQVGMIGVNVPIPVPMAFYSFGGWKDSLFGDTHVHGPEGVRFYTRGKAITSRWPDAQYATHHREHMHFPTAT
jgi:malonate-semialdehyde dehydrogenase (acetylating)/methylmalonate-semialdehyde dehydrogenase